MDDEQVKKQFDERLVKYFSYRQLTFIDTVKAYWRRFTAPVTGRGVKVDMGDGLCTRSFFYWEFVVFVEKVLLYIVVIFYTEINQGLQANVALFCVAVFFYI